MHTSTNVLRNLYSRCSYSRCNLIRCLQTRASYSTAPDAATTNTQAAKLTTRRLIHLHGEDAPKFLQGIITNNVSSEQNTTNGFFAAFLTAQGKVLHDVFVYPTTASRWYQNEVPGSDAGPGYMIEVDALQADTLLKHLKRHKLRSKFKMRLLDAEELNVWSVWKDDERWTQHTARGTITAEEGGGILALQDMRAPGMGQRLLLSPDIHVQNAAPLDDVTETPLEAYTSRRYLKGVPEGQDEIPRDDCLPMNYNFDIMNGIDFKKGCYIGQELTIRTQHTGVVRRRVLPVSLFPSDASPPETQLYDAAHHFGADLSGLDIKSQALRKRATGRLIKGIGNVGLAICRLEQMSDLNVTGTGSTFDPSQKFFIEHEDQQIGVKPFVPDWMRGRIREPRVQRRVE